MTTDNPLKSLADYSHFVAEMLDRPTVLRSTVVVLPGLIIELEELSKT